MAFTTQVLEDSQRNYIIKVVGSSTDAAALLVDVSTLAVPCETVKLWEVEYDVGPGVVVSLLWDATADVTLITMTEGPGQTLCFRDVGGINNNAGAGKTGDVLLTSTGTTIVYTLVLWFVKKNPTIRL